MDQIVKAGAVTADSIDPIVAEIISHGLQAISNEISANITRTAFSPLVYEYKDYACGLVDAEGRLIAQAEGSIPIFVADALGTAVRDGLHIYGKENIFPGDVIISNHAGTLGQHLNNVVGYTPVFDGENEDGELIGFMVVLVHWIDVGGKSVGSCTSNDSTEIFQEGIQYRTVKIWSKGEKNQELYRIIEYNTRFPAAVLGDLEAQLAGCLLGKEKFRSIVRKYGSETVKAAVQRSWDKCEMAARAAVARIPDGTYSGSAFLDSDGLNLDSPVKVNIKVIVEGSDVTIDLSDVNDQVEGSLNAGVLGGAVTASRIAFKCVTSPNEPANEGSFRPLKVVIPPGKFLSAAPTAGMAKYSAPLPTVIDTIIQAFGKADDKTTSAGHHASFSSHLLYGKDPETGELYQHLDSGLGGWGAVWNQDGGGPYKTMSHGDTLHVPIEVQEALFPHRVDRFSLRPDSCGAGKHRGGLGTEKVVTVLEPTNLLIAVERTKCPPWGVRGGKDGKPGIATIERDGKVLREIKKGPARLEAGDSFRLLTAGGGGFGHPSERDKHHIENDLKAGYISEEYAKTEFGYSGM